MANDASCPRPVRLQHVFATYDAGGPQVRTVELMRALGPRFAHSVVAADGRTGAASRTPPDVPIAAMRRPASTLRQLRDLVATLRRGAPDLVLTYNWGAMLGAVAARILGVPFVHHEEVVPPDERVARLRRRDWLRRLMLTRAAAIVVPTAALAARARVRWGVARGRVDCIPNGVDLAGRAVRDHAAAPRCGPLIVGTVAHARPEKNWSRLLHTFALLRTDRAELLIAGDGPERAASQQLAIRTGIAPHVRMLGAVDDARVCFGAMDVFVLASDDEQMPLALLEAMAHGLPITATAVGDVAAMVPPEQRRFVVPCDADAPRALARAIDELLGDAALRARLGAANRAHVERCFDARGVAARYAALYRRFARVDRRAELHA